MPNEEDSVERKCGKTYEITSMRAGSFCACEKWYYQGQNGQSLQVCRKRAMTEIAFYWCPIDELTKPEIGEICVKTTEATFGGTTIRKRLYKNNVMNRKTDQIDQIDLGSWSRLSTKGWYSAQML